MRVKDELDICYSLSLDKQKKTFKIKSGGARLAHGGSKATTSDKNGALFREKVLSLLINFCWLITVAAFMQHTRF